MGEGAKVLSIDGYLVAAMVGQNQDLEWLAYFDATASFRLLAPPFAILTRISHHFTLLRANMEMQWNVTFGRCTRGQLHCPGSRRKQLGQNLNLIRGILY